MNFTYAERWLYFALIGVMIFLAGFLELVKLSKRRLVAFALVVFIVSSLFGYRSFVRANLWGDELAFLETEVDHIHTDESFNYYLSIEYIRNEYHDKARDRLLMMITMKRSLRARIALGHLYFDHYEDMDAALYHYFYALREDWRSVELFDRILEVLEKDGNLIRSINNSGVMDDVVTEYKKEERMSVSTYNDMMNQVEPLLREYEGHEDFFK